MYRTCENALYAYQGLYRSAGEIRRDIRAITGKIEETVSMLNVRSLLLDILAGERAHDPGQLIPDVEEAIADAGTALESFKALKEELSLLEEELLEARCITSKWKAQ